MRTANSKTLLAGVTSERGTWHSCTKGHIKSLNLPRPVSHHCYFQCCPCDLLKRRCWPSVFLIEKVGHTLWENNHARVLTGDCYDFTHNVTAVITLVGVWIAVAVLRLNAAYKILHTPATTGTSGRKIDYEVKSPDNASLQSGTYDQTTHPPNWVQDTDQFENLDSFAIAGFLDGSSPRLLRQSSERHGVP